MATDCMPTDMTIDLYTRFEDMVSKFVNTDSNNYVPGSAYETSRCNIQNTVIDENGRLLFECLAQAIQSVLDKERQDQPNPNPNNIDDKGGANQANTIEMYTNPDFVHEKVVDLLATHATKFMPVLPLLCDNIPSAAKPNEQNRSKDQEKHLEAFYQSVVKDCKCVETYQTYSQLCLYAAATCIQTPLYILCENQKGQMKWVYYQPLFECNGQPMGFKYLTMFMSSYGTFHEIVSNDLNAKRPIARGLVGLFFSILKDTPETSIMIPDKILNWPATERKKMCSELDIEIVLQCCKMLKKEKVVHRQDYYRITSSSEFARFVENSPDAFVIVCQVLLKRRQRTYLQPYINKWSEFGYMSTFQTSALHSRFEDATTHIDNSLCDDFVPECVYETLRSEKNNRVVQDYGRSLYDGLALTIRLVLDTQKRYKRKTYSASQVNTMKLYTFPDYLHEKVVDLLLTHGKQIMPVLPLLCDNVPTAAMQNEQEMSKEQEKHLETFYQTVLTDCIFGTYDSFPMLCLYAAATCVQTPIYVLCENKIGKMQWAYYQPLLQCDGQPNGFKYITIFMSSQKKFHAIVSNDGKAGIPIARGLAGMYFSILEDTLVTSIIVPDTLKNLPIADKIKMCEELDHEIFQQCCDLFCKENVVQKEDYDRMTAHRADRSEFTQFVQNSPDAFNIVCQVLIKLRKRTFLEPCISKWNEFGYLSTDETILLRNMANNFDMSGRDDLELERVKQTLICEDQSRIVKSNGLSMFECIADGVKSALKAQGQNGCKSFNVNGRTINVNTLQKCTDKNYLHKAVIDILSKYAEQFIPHLQILCRDIPEAARETGQKRNKTQTKVLKNFYQSVVNDCKDIKTCQSYADLCIYAVATVIHTPIYILSKNQNGKMQWVYYQPLFESDGLIGFKYLTMFVSCHGKFHTIVSDNGNTKRPIATGLVGTPETNTRILNVLENLPAVDKNNLYTELKHEVVLECCRSFRKEKLIEKQEFDRITANRADRSEFIRIVEKSEAAFSIVCQILLQCREEEFLEPYICKWNVFVRSCDFLAKFDALRALDIAIRKRSICVSAFVDSCKAGRQELDERRKNVNTAVIASSAVGIGSGGLIILGIILTPISFGASLVLSVAGAAAGVISGGTAAGVRTHEAVKQNSKITDIKAEHEELQLLEQRVDFMLKKVDEYFITEIENSSTTVAGWPGISRRCFLAIGSALRAGKGAAGIIIAAARVGTTAATIAASVLGPVSILSDVAFLAEAAHNKRKGDKTDAGEMLQEKAQIVDEKCRIKCKIFNDMRRGNYKDNEILIHWD